MKIEIKSRWNGSILFSAETETIKLAVELAVKSQANLTGAYLYGANLSGAYLSGAYLYGANLSGANLSGAKLSWLSHDLLAECLLRAAGEDAPKRSFAGLVLISRDWCWEKFLKLKHPLRGWAIKTLAGYVVEGDDAPEIIRKAAKVEKEARR